MAGPQLWLLSCWLALSFLGFCLGIFAAWIGAKLLGTGESLKDILKLTGESTKAAAKRTAIAMTIPVISTVIFGGMCFWAGYGWRDHELTTNVRTLLNVDVLEAYPAGNYGMRTETGTAFPIYPCPAPDGSVTVKFHPGSRLKILTYERRADCFIVKYFLPDTDQNGRLKGELANVRE